MAEFPEVATAVGWPGQNHRWTDLSREAIARRRREREAPARVLATIDRRRLSAADRLNHDLFRHQVDEALEERRFPSELLAVNQLEGVQRDVAETLALMPTATVAHHEDVLARLGGVPALVAQTRALLDDGLARGVTPPRVALRALPAQALEQIPDEPWSSPLLRPFADMPAAIPGAEQERLRARALELYERALVPTFRAFHAYLVERYLPGARETVGLAALPDGAAWYAFLVRRATTTTLGAAEIHAIGLAEVERIRAGMDALMAETRFRGDFEDFAEHLRTDDRFFFEDAEALLAAYRAVTKRADPELVRLFGRLPRLPYGVRAIPPYAAPSAPAAYYQPGSRAGLRPGWFFVNTHDLRSRPRWAMEPLALHEAVPGHHLQVALAQELEGVPEFRRHAHWGAFVEGWGLYAEGLGAEMGFYGDPWSRVGRLAFEAWRAVRLVVDTGVHALGWSRAQAIAYFRTNTALAPHDVEVEVDRYLVWPAQALTYKIGERRLLALRRRAEDALGASFDVRAFHDAVLAAGPLPLDMLEDRVDVWIAEARTAHEPRARPSAPRAARAGAGAAAAYWSR
jgi:uncharacterized protein (DUF885 family)